MQLFIGKKYFNITTSPINNSRIGIKVDDDMSLVGANISKRMVASLTEEDAGKMKKFSEDVKSKVKITYTNNWDSTNYDKKEKPFLSKKRKYK